MLHVLSRLTIGIILIVLTNQGTAADPSDLRPQAITVRGDVFRGRLARIDEDWHITFDAGEKRHVLAADDLIRWGEFRDREVGPLVVLADGGILVADRGVRVATDQVTISSRRLWNTTSIPLDLVRGVLYQPSTVPLERDRQVRAILSAQGETDQLWLANGDRVAGLIRAKDEARDDSNTQILVVETAEQSLTVPTDRIASLIFNPALIRQPRAKGMRAMIGFRDGSHLLVDQVSPQKDRLKLTLIGGVNLESYPDFDAESVWDEIVMLRPNSSRVTYLSDLDPLSFKTVPYLEKALEFRRDENVQGGQLRVGGVAYEKGIGMHSTSRLAYRLAGGEYRQFAAELAMDDLAGGRGSVQFRVYLAGADGKWTRAFESDIIRGGQTPVPISVDIADSQAIALIVDFADYGDQLDYANWLNARLVK